ncbi:MAG: hypothetical protein JSS72_03635 [Armatimonadetes bacterium]|nr:hypothetical protein [Armatimonadota bacterium]
MRFLVSTTVLLAHCIAPAQSNHLKGYPMSTPPKIDGVIEDSEWGQVPYKEGFTEANTNKAESHRTRFWLGYDNRFVYIAGRLEASEPSKIVATETHTNGDMGGDDYFEVQIDPSGTLTEFSSFRINPLGTTRTQLAGGRAVKREWAGEIEAKSRITAMGWEFEARIPWQLMRLGTNKAKRGLRLNAVRHVPADNLTYNWRFVANDSTNYGYWDSVETPAAEVDRSIQLLPYVFGGYDPGHQPLDAGLDMRSRLNANLTAVASINPDFRNVENAILSLDFSRFARIAAETRPFMLEGGQYLGGSAILQTQKIPDFDIGTKVYGRLSDKISTGVLNTTEFGNFSDTAAQFDVSWNQARTSRFSVVNKTSPDVKNTAVLANYGYTISPTWYSFTRFVGTDDNARGQGHELLTNINYGNAEWQGSAEYIERSPQLFPALGYLPNIDIRGYDGGLVYQKNFEKGNLSRFVATAAGDEFHHYHGGMYQRDWVATLALTTSKQVQTTYNYAYARFDGVDDTTHEIKVLFPANNARTNASVDYVTGTANNDPYRSLSLAAHAYLKRKLQLTTTYQKIHLLGENSDQFIVSGNYDLDESRSIAGRVVKTGPDTNAYLSYRKAGNKGAEYYLILGNPNAQRTRGSILIKFVTPLTIKR